MEEKNDTLLAYLLSKSINMLLRILMQIRDIHIECSKQTIKMKLILCVLVEPAVLGSAKPALEFKFEI